MFNIAIAILEKFKFGYSTKNQIAFGGTNNIFVDCILNWINFITNFGALNFYGIENWVLVDFKEFLKFFY